MIIAFSGRAGSGKSTAFEAIRASSEGRAVCLTKFASPLYQMQETLYRLISPVYERPADFVKDRKLLQWIGTEWGRDTISKTLWVDLWKARVNHVRARDPELIVVCDDCRYENEAQTVKAMGGVIVALSSNRSFDIGGIAGHASEAGFPAAYIDYTVENNGTVEEFQEAIKALVIRIKADETKREERRKADEAAAVQQANKVPEGGDFTEDDFLPETSVQTKAASAPVAEDSILTEDDFLPTT